MGEIIVECLGCWFGLICEMGSCFAEGCDGCDIGGCDCGDCAGCDCAGCDCCGTGPLPSCGLWYCTSEDCACCRVTGLPAGRQPTVDDHTSAPTMDGATSTPIGTAGDLDEPDTHPITVQPTQQLSEQPDHPTRLWYERV